MNIWKWFGTSSITISALIVSFNIEWASHWWAFVGFLVGHIVWSTSAYKMRDWPLFALNFTFVFIDIYAMSIRI